MPHKAGALAEALGRLRLDVDRTALRDLASEVEWARSHSSLPRVCRGRASGAP